MVAVSQFKFSELELTYFDAMIVASGFESRASFQVKKFRTLPKEKIALCFDNEVSDKTRKKNDLFFKSKGFELITISNEQDNIELLQTILDKIIYSSSEDCIRIYIDYSSMIRNWYASIIYIVSNLRTKKPISLFFGYSHAEFISSSHLDVLNKVVEPLFGYCNLSVPFKPTALVICLGNEKNRVYGLQEYFDAATYLFYSDASFDNEYSVEVEKVNFEILKSAKAQNVFRFPVHDLLYTDYLIENLCKVLLKDYRVVIAPCGPKPFILLSLINSIKFRSDIEVWRISPGSGLPKINREPNGRISVLEAKFEIDNNMG